MESTPLISQTPDLVVGWNDLDFDVSQSQFDALWIVVVSGREESVRSVSVGTYSDDRGLLIQSDKSLYKPGETAKFRVIPLQRDLRTFDAEITMKLTSPDGMILAEWTDVPSTTNGFVKAEFPIDANLGDSFLGEWTIDATSGEYSTSKTFRLEEYVLQKFSVSVEKPSYILSTQSILEISVRGEYTYGEGVHGTARLQYRSAAQTECWGYYWYFPGRIWESGVCGFSPSTKSSCTCDWSGNSNDYYSDWYGTPQPLIELSAELVNGDATFEIDTSTIHEFGNYDVCLQVIVEEEGTSISFTEQASVLVDDNPYKVLFEDSSCVPGFDYSTEITFADPSGIQVSPPGETEIRVYAETEASGWQYTYSNDIEEFDQTEYSVRTEISDSFITTTKLDDTGGKILLTVDANGFDITAYKLIVEVNYGERQSSQEVLNVACLYAKNAETGEIATARIRVSSDVSSARVDDTVSFSYVSTSDVGAVYYTLLSGQTSGPEPSAVIESGVFTDSTSTIDLLVTIDHVPAIRCVVFAADGTLLADQTTVTISPRYGETSAEFSQSDDDGRVLPGSDVDIEMFATAGSTMLVGIVDSSVLLMSTPNDITDNYIVSQGFIPQQSDTGCQWQLDANQVLTDAGLSLIASDFANIPLNDNYYPVMWYEDDMVMVDSQPEVQPAMPEDENRGPADAEDASSEVQQRSFFPESWLWIEVPMNSTTASIASVAPDTITEWTMTAISVSPTSELGISTTSTLTTFKPFFVQVSTAYEVIRNEQFSLNLTAFNYEETALEITVTLELPSELALTTSDTLSSQGFTENGDGSLSSVWTVPPKESLTKNIPVIASEVGTFSIVFTGIPEGSLGDSVTRTLSVVPEGLQEILTKNIAVSGDDGIGIWQEMSVVWPENRVGGSENILVSFTGDLMGSTIANLDHLIRQPYGCGEQNIVSMAPQAYVYQYLEATSQLSGEQKSDIIANLHRGYTRELGYMHSGEDLGGYSAFGDSDESPSTFLTAFVLNVFLDIKELEPSFGEKIVDPATLEQSISWLLADQDRDGRFPIIGRVFNTAMRGGISDTDGMTCYITWALSKAVDQEIIESNSQIEDAKNIVATIVSSYLNKDIPLEEIYSFSLCAHAHLKANADASDHSLVYNKLVQLAKTDIDVMWWDNQEESDDTQDEDCGWYCDRSEDALALEMTAYNLMSVLEVQEPLEGRSIATWMTRQRNSNGGFFSSQDTCVGLKALAAFGAASNQEALDLEVEISLANGESRTFTVSDDNRQTYQLQVFDVDNDNPEGSFQWRVSSGEGTAYLAMTQRYHYLPKPPAEEDRFVLVAQYQSASRRNLEADSGCGSLDISTNWASEESSSGMVILNAKALSGCCFEESALQDLQAANELVKMYEHECSEFTIYFDELPTDSVEFSIPQYMSFPVENQQSQPVYVQEYYNPANMKSAAYKSESTDEEPIENVGFVASAFIGLLILQFL